MALIKSKMAQGLTPVPTAGYAGVVVVQRSPIKLTAAAAENDILELGILPARNYPVSIAMVADGVTLGAVGVMSGKPDDPDAGRTIETTIVTSNAINDAGRKLAPVEHDRSIGVTIGAGGAAIGKELWLVMTYAQG